MYCCEIDSLFLFCLFCFHNQLNFVRSSVRLSVHRSMFVVVVIINSERCSRVDLMISASCSREQWKIIACFWCWMSVCVCVFCCAVWYCVVSVCADGWWVGCFHRCCSRSRVYFVAVSICMRKNVVDGLVSCLPAWLTDWLHWLLIHEKCVVGTQRRKYVASLNKQWLHRRIRRRSHVNMCYEWNWGSGLGAWWSVIGW